MGFLNMVLVQVEDLLRGWKLPAGTAELLSKIAVYGLLVYLVMSLLILIGRLAKKLKPSVGFLEQFVELVVELLLAAGILGVVAAATHMPEIISFIHTNDLGLNLNNLGGDLIKFGVVIVTVGFMLYLFVSVLVIVVKYVITMVKSQLEQNGAALGTFLSVYDLISGASWVALGLILYAFARPWLG